MPSPHTEHHFEASDTVRDIVIGMADGLTVPFALAAGISGAAVAIEIIVTAGLAEIAAGSIAMGLGGYLAARSQRQHYFTERRREEQEILTVPHRERKEVIDIMARYGVTKQECEPILSGLERNPLARLLRDAQSAPLQAACHEQCLERVATELLREESY